MLKFADVVSELSVLDSTSCTSGFELFVGKPVGHSIKTIRVDRSNPTTLVAGMVGSGKTMLLLNIVAGLHSIKRNCLIVDYLSPKGIDELCSEELSKKGVSINPHIGLDACVQGLFGIEAQITDRINTIQSNGFDNLEQYNKENILPICDKVVIIDELSCLVDEAPNGVMEELLTNILKKAQSVGIYVIMATQNVMGISDRVLGSCCNIISLRVNERISDRLLGSDVASKTDYKDRFLFVRSNGGGENCRGILQYELPFISLDEFKELCISNADFEL